MKKRTLSIVGSVCALFVSTMTCLGAQGQAKLPPNPLLVDALTVPSPSEFAMGIQTAAGLLVDNQEIYLDDPPVPSSLTPWMLAAYQAAEEIRLDRIRRWSAGFAKEWPYEGLYRVGTNRHIPSGYRVGGTAIVCSALLRAPGYALHAERQAAIDRGVLFLLDLLANDPTLSATPTIGYDVRGWGHLYALQFFLHALDAGAILDPLIATQVQTAAQGLIDAIELNETLQGGWSYSSQGYVCPFMTGPTLLALYHANARGFAVDATVVNRALDALQASRTTQGTFQYDGSFTDVVTVPESSARSASAELALFLAGRSSQDDLRRALIGFLTSWDLLFERKSQQGAHAGPHLIAPYYFFYGHTYAALAIESLPANERPRWRSMIARLLWLTREDDGGWNDRIYPRTKGYATGMALIALTARSGPPLSTW